MCLSAGASEPRKPQETKVYFGIWALKTLGSFTDFAPLK